MRYLTFCSMSQQQSLLKNALLEELSNGRFRLLQPEIPEVPVTNIEFQNRKAARNWGRSRGYLVADLAPDGTTINGAN